MKKILHVVNISFVIPYFLGKQLNYFNDSGYKEYIICSPSDELKDFSLQYNFKYKEVDILRSISIFKDLIAVFDTIKYIRENKIDIIVGHTPKGALIAMLAGFICRIPKRIYFRHGLVYETSTCFKRLLLKNIDRIASSLSTKIICVSESVCIKSIADRLNNKGKQQLLSRGTCNGIDIKRFSKNSISKDKLTALKNKIGIEDNDFIIGFTGRLVRDKGIQELVNAFNLLSYKHPNIKLLLVGKLEERDALSQTVVDVILNNSNIITTGYVPNSSIEYYYALMDIFVLPSYREGFPTSVLEASSMEVPVITTRVTGCIDSIIEGETGIFVDNTGLSLYNGLESLYKDKQAREYMGHKGRLFVEKYFRQEIIWNEIEKLYQ